MALLVTSVFGVTGCGSDDGEAPVESRIKNSTGYWNYGDIIPQSYGERYDPLAYYHEIDRLDEMYHYNDQYDDDIAPRLDASDAPSKADCDLVRHLYDLLDRRDLLDRSDSSLVDRLDLYNLYDLGDILDPYVPRIPWSSDVHRLTDFLDLCFHRAKS